MTRKPAAPGNLRNGLKCRDGRPYWEPSPANRACGFKGMVLQNPDGSWMDRGAATSAADARSLWAAIVRDALRDDETQSKKLVARFPRRRVETITRPELREWYLDLCEELSIASANQIVGVAGAMFKLAMRQLPEAWITANPCTDLGTKKAKAGASSGSSPSNRPSSRGGTPTVSSTWPTAPSPACGPARARSTCAPELSGDTWRYVPSKTEKNGQMETARTLETYAAQHGYDWARAEGA